ncbi:uncharacterized protein KGF55_000565 [Candida pseudojiufengensis]|uniref:uncharacterized protein n=1 Tax=Candida pseudojiufengensis TaxID=497109 RepID=UPI0022247672|nr:uncharacterized protein KGF55_000565 [Candida pseudojiufengensis]KAI5966256.1 hypothetical protein KGF55_000565 [Candida pseudojiufengensis]
MFNQHLHLSYFDVKIKSHHKNLLLIKGNEFEVEHVLLEGSVKISSKEDIHVKKIKLNLIGEFYYEYMSKETHEQFLDRLCVLKIDWDNLLCDDEGKVVFGNYGDGTIPMYKLKKGTVSDASGNTSGTSSPRPQYHRTKSTPQFNVNGTSKAASKIVQIPKSGIDGTPFKDLKDSSLHSFLLPKGNYSLPFKVYLPASVSETVESLPIGTLLYKLQCSIERGRFERAHQISKHIRIVRTLHPQNMNLCDSIDVNNTWVGKLQYCVSMPKKGVAIGSTVPIHITIVPIAKGLSIKAINACIVEHYHIQLENQRSPEYERLCGKQPLTIPPNSDIEYDRWVIKTHFKVPNQLKQITQSCETKNSMIVVKHRLRVAIQLKNKEGHTSELRANLPIYVYISANIGHVVGRHYDVDNHHGTFQLDYKKEDVLFHKKESAPTTPAVSDDEDEGEEEEEEEENEEGDNLDREDTAPPLYEKHKFDKIYDMNLPQTPMEQLRSQSGTPLASANNSVTNLSEYFDIPIAKAIEMNNKKLKKRNKSVDFSHIPSYNEAIDDDDEEDSYIQDGFAPTYTDGSGSESASLKSGSTTPIKIMSNPKLNNSTGHFKLSLKHASTPNSRSNSFVKLDKLAPDSPKLGGRFFKKKDK